MDSSSATVTATNAAARNIRDLIMSSECLDSETLVDSILLIFVYSYSRSHYSNTDEQLVKYNCISSAECVKYEMQLK